MNVIKLSNSNDVALVDDEDHERLAKYNWQKSTNGYAIRSEGTDKVYLHQEVCPTPPGVYADHVNGQRLDNRRCNLRPATHSQNGQRRKVQVNNSSGYRGVSQSPNGWRSQIYVNNKRISLGYYKDAAAAARAYDRAALQYFGSNAATNFPQETDQRATC